MNHFEELVGEIDRGIEGKNNAIPIGFRRLNKFIGVRKRIYSLIFGATGTGKSAFVHEAFILNPFEHYIANKGRGPRVKPILFSQERSKLYTKAKWLSRKIFLTNGTLIPIGKMLGWWETKLTMDERNLINMYEDYINELCEFVVIIEGANNPTGIYKPLKAYMEAHGTIEEISEYKKIYIPNDDDEIVEPIVDTMGLTKTEKGMNKKESVDKVSEYLQYFRDFAGYSPIAVSQMNRDKSNPAYTKMDSFEPTIDDVKESGRPGEDSDLILSLFQPSRYKTNDVSYKVSNFVDPETAIDYFRRIKVLKNTYGEADVGAGMGFMGATGIFKELPKKSDMEIFDYNSLFDYSYFL